MSFRSFRYIFSTVAECFLIAVGLLVAVELIRSHFIGDGIQWIFRSAEGDAFHEFKIGCSAGKGRLVLSLGISHGRVNAPEARQKLVRGTELRHFTMKPNELIDIGWSDSNWGRAGFAFNRNILNFSAIPFYSSDYKVGAPLWVVVVLMLTLPSWRTKTRLVRMIRKRQSKCVNCGYDLRVSKERCPECGRAILDRTGK